MKTIIPSSILGVHGTWDTQQGNGKTAIFDLETDGLLGSITKIWCISIREEDSNDKYFYGPDEIEEGVKKLQEYTTICGHNIIEFDLPAIRKVMGTDLREVCRVIDTLVLSRLEWPDRPVPAGFKGMASHSLEAWGYRLLLAKPEHEDWTQFSEDMKRRCEGDTELTKMLLEEMKRRYSDHKWGISIQTEHVVADEIVRQEENGVKFDMQLASDLVHTLESRISEIDKELSEEMPGKWVQVGVEIKEPFLKSGALSARVIQWTEGKEDVRGPFCRVKYDPINLNSDKQVKEYLLSVGWEPIEYNYNKTTGEPSSPKLVFSDEDDDGISGDLGRKIKSRKLLSHRVNQVLGLLGNVRDDGRVPAGANPLGTPTGRMRHRVVVNIPKASKKIPYGTEMRSLFTVPDGRLLVGYDASGIELRMLAHYMNDPDYTREILDGDIHTFNQNMAGLPTRDDAKTFIYAFIYGAGDAKIGSIVGGDAKDGKAIKEVFLKKIPALDKLIKGVRRSSRKGYLRGLDNRKLYLRRDSRGDLQTSKSLNLLLQAGGAAVMKQSILNMRKWVAEERLDAYKVLDMHDEAQWDTAKDVAERVGQLGVDSIVKAGELFKLNIPLAGEYKIGKNWAETH